MRRALLLVLMAAGCKFSHTLADGAPGGDDGGSGGSDGVIADAVPDALDPTSCLAHWMAHDVQLTTPATIPMFAQFGYEEDIFLSADDLTLYESTDCFNSSSDGDIYSGTRSSATATDWTDPGLHEETALTTGVMDEKVAIQGTVAILARQSGGANGIDLYEASVGASGAIGAFGQGNLANVDGTTDDYDPWLSADGTRLYYAPYDGVTGTQTIKVSTRSNATKKFGVPVDVPLLEGGNVGDPFLANDEKLILYTTGGDVHYATRASSDLPFEAPTALAGVDTSGLEGDAILSSDACTVLFSRSADGGLDSHDIYTATVMH